MTKTIKVKTNRTSSGYACAKVTRFGLPKGNKWYICYSFKFYNKHEFFDTYKQLREYFHI